MRTFKIVLMLAWTAVVLNLVLSGLFGAYSRSVPYEVEGALFLGAVALTAAYKVGQLYRAGMKRPDS